MNITSTRRASSVIVVRRGCGQAVEMPTNNVKPSMMHPFPMEVDGYAFIAFHESWNRNVPTGYTVVYVAVENGQVDLTSCPVDLAAEACGRLLVTSDGPRENGVFYGDGVIHIELSSTPSLPSPSVQLILAILKSLSSLGIGGTHFFL